MPVAGRQANRATHSWIDRADPSPPRYSSTQEISWWNTSAYVFRESRGCVVIVDRPIQTGDTRTTGGDRPEIVAYDHDRQAE